MTCATGEDSLDVGRVHCPRHPATAWLRGYCSACLLEAALAPAEPGASAPVRSFTIEVPLGESETASVFLVREDAATSRLFRLKRWRTLAPAGFIDGFKRLRAQLHDWRPPTIVLPITAWVDAAGCPSVVSEFRQGMPLLAAVSAGWLRPEQAGAALSRLRETLEQSHARGLAHGSVVPGNVFSARPDGAAYLLDFGLAPLVFGFPAPADGAAADCEGVTRLQAQLERLRSPSV
jgi:serine/threonine protein kinase